MQAIFNLLLTFFISLFSPLFLNFFFFLLRCFSDTRFLSLFLFLHSFSSVFQRHFFFYPQPFLLRCFSDAFSVFQRHSFGVSATLFRCFSDKNSVFQRHPNINIHRLFREIINILFLVNKKFFPAT